MQSFLILKILKEPLLHFAAIGGLLFGLYAVVNPDEFGGETHILVDSGRIDNLSAQFQRTWNRPPNEVELKGLVDDFVIEEILYRQALAMGMDKNDAMIRRRLRQKMEFVTTDAVTLFDASDDELDQYLRAHPEKFARDPVYSFEQIYINADGSSEEVQARLSAIQQQLHGDTADLGDRTLLPREFNQATAFSVDRTFGENFATQLDALSLNQWSQPLRSGLGIHLVKLSSRQASELPVLSEVRAVVLREWQNDKNQSVKAALLENLLAQYQIDVQWPGADARNAGG
jgi:hypothetical protein